MIEVLSIVNLIWVVFTLCIVTILVSLNEYYSIIDLLFYTYLLSTGIVLAINSVVFTIQFYIKEYANMNKEDMTSILNQHGIDALYAAIEDELDKAFDAGYDVGYEDGLYESCDNNSDAKLLL